MRKKVFSILLSLAMVITMMPAMSMTAFAVDTATLANFDPCNGENVLDGAAEGLAPSQNPSWKNYKFLGWYNARTGGTKVTSDYIPEETYYAHWAVSNTNSNQVLTEGISVSSDGLYVNDGIMDLSAYGISFTPASGSNPAVVTMNNAVIDTDKYAECNYTYAIPTPRTFLYKGALLSLYNSIEIKSIGKNSIISSKPETDNPLMEDYIFAGVICMNDITTSGSELSVAVCEGSYSPKGILCLNLNNKSKLNVNVGDALSDSVAINTYNDFNNYSGAEINATVGKADSATVINVGTVGGTITNNGIINVSAGEATVANAGIMVNSGIEPQDSYGNLINKGQISAVTGKSDASSYVVFTMGDISNSGVISADANFDTLMSYGLAVIGTLTNSGAIYSKVGNSGGGISVEEDFIISGGKVTAYSSISTTGVISADSATVTGANEEFVSGTTNSLTQAGTDPIIIKCKEPEDDYAISLLRAYTGGKVGKKAVKLCWNKVPGATKYKVYGTRCGGKFKKLKEYKTTRKYTVKKIGGKKLLAHKTYKFYVAAYDKDGKRITRSKVIHFITATTRGKYANVKSISVNKTSAFIGVNNTLTLKVKRKIYNNKKHISETHGTKTRFITDNPSVATVSKTGKITAKGIGTATIYTQDIGGRYCKTKVSVVIPVEKVSLQATADAFVGLTTQLSVTVLPEEATNKSVKWETSNKKVVTVDKDGNIKGIAKGTATITARSVTNPTKKATCKVTVYSECLADGTLITMADESKVAVENLKRGDEVVTFNHETGEKSHSSIIDYYKYGENSSKAMTLHFSDSFDVTVVTGHTFYDKSLKKYVDITIENVGEYIGHKFFCMEDMSWKTLNGYTKLNEKKDSYVVVTKNHLNCVADGMLTNEDDFYSMLANVFEFDDNMKINQNKKNADIQKYGLWTYKDIHYLTEEAFDGLNLKYLGILVGKGIITKDEIEERASYVPAFDPEIVVPEKRND